MTKQDNTNDDSDTTAEGREPDIADETGTDGRASAPDTAEGVESAPGADAPAPRPRTKAARTKADRRASSPADDPADDTDTPAPARASTAARGKQISLTFTTAGLVKTLGALVVVAAVVGVALLGWGYHQQGQKLSAFDDSKVASEQFVTKLVGTMTKDGVGDMKELLGPLSTGEFRKHLEQQQSDTAAAVTQLNLQDAESTVKSVSVESFDTTTARTSVLMEVSGKSALAPDGGKSLMLLWLDLRKEDGQWLVSQLSGAQAGIGPEQGGQNPGQAPAQPTAPAAPANPAAPAPAG